MHRIMFICLVAILGGVVSSRTLLRWTDHPLQDELESAAGRQQWQWGVDSM
jgi:hypothetical protein